MSSEALAWAFKSEVKPSSVKFTLVALCECANYQTGKIFPSIKHLCQITGQDRKTVISNIGKLVSEGWIDETGERVGRTGQIKVYQANIGTVPKVEQSQERNGSAFPLKESQKRDTEPSREPSRHIIEVPAWFPMDAWQGWVDMRKQRKKPLTDRAYNQAIDKLVAFEAKGQNITEVLDRSTMNNWLDLYEIKEQKNGTTNRQHATEPTNPMVRAVLASQAKRSADGERFADDWA